MEVAVAAKDYLKEFGIDTQRVTHRFTFLLEAMHAFIKKYNFADNVIINGRLLEQSVVDYFVDSVRVKEFHHIDNTNTEKIYAYSTYWLLKRKPLQVLKPFKKCEFINEGFLTIFLTSNIASEKGFDEKILKNNKAFRKFQELLYYNLKYRPVSPQSLELMIEAFFGGCGFVLAAATK